MQHRTGILVVNTGSPVEPHKNEIKIYLNRFLSDIRIVDLPRWQWMPILHLFILPNRPAHSAERYEKIWTDEGSPLILETANQTAAIAAELAKRGITDVPIDFCCRYSGPEIDDVLHELLDVQGCDRLVILPLYAQYASVTNGSLGQAVLEACAHRLRIPSVDFIDSYCDNDTYLDALAESVRRSDWTWVDDGHHAIVFTFHSTLCKDIEGGDVYQSQVEETCRGVAERLGIPEGGWHVGFQSIFDDRPWLHPLVADELIPELADAGITDLAIAAPGFTSECLETLFDVDIEQRAAFESRVPNGTFTYIPCLGCDPTFIKALADVVQPHLLI